MLELCLQNIYGFKSSTFVEEDALNVEFFDNYLCLKFY
jgi:hypothetical protein